MTFYIRLRFLFLTSVFATLALLSFAAQLDARSTGESQAAREAATANAAQSTLANLATAVVAAASQPVAMVRTAASQVARTGNAPTDSFEDYSHPTHAKSKHFATVAIKTKSPLSSGQVNLNYQVAFSASGGASPYSWSVTSGTPAPGLNLDSANGVLSGTPTMAGTFTFTIQVLDSAGDSAQGAFSLTIAPGVPPLAIATSSLPTATAGTAYSTAVQASGGTAPYAWSVVSGQLPLGLSLSASGQISGTPSAAGQSNFTVEVQDSSSIRQTATASLSINVVSPVAPLAITTTSLTQGVLGAAYSATLQANGGTAPYNWSVSSGQLPPGLSLSANGQISGTPTATGSYSFATVVADSSSPTQTAAASLSITVIAPALSVIPASVDFGNVPLTTSSTQSVQVTNSGSATLTISQASISGTGFSMNGLTLPVSVAAGQSVYFNVVFLPTAYGSATGTVALASNDPSSPTSIALSGTSHNVTLSWTASTSSVVGYFVYRTDQPGGSYTQLNTTPVNATTYDDTSVVPGQTYYYVVTAVDSNDVQSVYSNQASATVPTP